MEKGKMIKCAQCGTELADNAIFSSNCGEKLIKNKTCPGCGAVCDKSVKFCSQCGFNFTAAAQAAPQPAAAPAPQPAPAKPDAETVSGFDLEKVAADQAKGIVFAGATLIKYPENLSDTSYQCPAGITKIGENAFRSCDNLRSVSLPDTIVELEKSAFMFCSRLTTINLPEGITKIGSECFWHCVSLKSIKLPNSLETLSEEMFKGCTGLTSLAIPGGIIAIPESLCSGCTNLTHVSMPPEIDQIGSRAFEATGLTSVKIPKGFTQIPVYYFGGPFDNCNKLKTVYIHKESVLDKESIKRLLPKRTIFNQVEIAYYRED